MAALITTAPVTATYQSYQLSGFADMASALNYLYTHGGYFGSLHLDSTGAWQLTIQNTATNTSQTANIGDYIVIKNGSIASVVPQAQYAQQFSP